MDDDDVFDHLDELHRDVTGFGSPRDHAPQGATHCPVRDMQSTREYAHGHAGDFGRRSLAFVGDELEQLDVFEEQLLEEQPNHTYRGSQRAVGQARQSRAPSSTGQSRRGLPAHPVQPEWHSQQPSFVRSSEGSRGPIAGVSPHRQHSTLSPAEHMQHDHQLRQSRYTMQQSNNKIATRGQYPELQDPPPGVQSLSSTLPTPATDPLITKNIVPRKCAAGTPVVQGIALVPTAELSDRFRAVFPFPLFNAVQSKCFNIVYKSSDNVVVSAPTGSGKTALFELAVCRLVNELSNETFKVVYQAPTKSLCSERQRDWQAKFAHLDLQCAELTGDTEYANLRNVQHASIIITTPEKWDSMTRKWKDHQRLMNMVKLFLVDEVHILKEDRGATLEAVVSRMKSVGSGVRFVALSATVPNAHDIAAWLGKNCLNPDVPAALERFGEEFRPVRLQRHVCGYSIASANDFAFERTLNKKLIDVIEKWSQRKSIMVFCCTRRSCAETAKALANWWSSQNRPDRYWHEPNGHPVLRDKDLRQTIKSGVAFHHAGLSNEDRIAVETGYLAGDISVICCTSTLAVGVNLPCHMVIIKGTVTYQADVGTKEYSDLEIMQMLGRAGRPQFDTSAVAVIMTRLSKAEMYNKMVSGQEKLESRLHLNLVEHLNSEISLGTVTNVVDAKRWLTGTFLYVRLKDNPLHYRLTSDARDCDVDECLRDICSKSIASLREHDLVTSASTLRSTEFGDAMARYYIRFETMKLLLALPPQAKISEILSAISKAAEYGDVRFRPGEKPMYKELNKNCSIKFPIPVNIDSPAHKVSLIIQSVLGAIDLPGDQHQFEHNMCKVIVFQHASRLIRCIIDCQIHLEDSVAARNALMLARSFGGKVWDDSPLHIKQLGGLGIVYTRKLVMANIKSIEELSNTETLRIETTCSRNPPFGQELQQLANAFPRPRVSLKKVGEPILVQGEGVLVRVKAEIGFMNDKVPEIFQRKPVYVCLLADNSDGHHAHFSRISARKMGQALDELFNVKLTSPSQEVRCFVSCDEIAGTQQSATLKLDIPSFMFPTPKTGQVERKPTEAAHMPNTSERRALAASQLQIPQDHNDEFSDDNIDDTDLAAVVDNDAFADISDFDEYGNYKPRRKEASTTTKPATMSQPLQPRRLDNGKLECGHPCKNKAACLHKCCNDGIEKKPKPRVPKRVKKHEATQGPKQTQLDLTKSKMFDSNATPTVPPSSTAPSRKFEYTFDARSLDKLHNSMKSSGSKVSMLKDRLASTQPRSFSSNAGRSLPNRRPEDDASSTDYGLDSLDAGDLPNELNWSGSRDQALSALSGGSADFDDSSDEMLEPFHEDIILALNGHKDQTKGSFQGGPYTSLQDSRFNQAMDTTEKDKSATEGSNGHGVFVTGSSSSSILPTPAPSRTHGQVTSKHPLGADSANPSTPARPSKRAKSDLSREEADRQPAMPKGNNPSPTAPTTEPPPLQPHPIEDGLDAVKTWFYREFGTKLFHIVD